MSLAPRALISGAEALGLAARASGAGPVLAAPAPPLDELAAWARAHGEPKVCTDSEAAGMAYGAAAAGLVPLLVVAGPGLGRVAETLSAACASELPMVVAACSRGGPGGGNDSPTQSDFVVATQAPGPGGAVVPVFAPASVGEVLTLYPQAVAWARRERTPVLLLLDALIARTREAVVPPEPATEERSHGVPHALESVLGAAPKPKEALEALGYHLFEKSRAWEGQGQVEELACEDARWLLVAYGSPARIARTAVEKARKRGLALGLLRPVSLRPFPEEALKQVAARADGVLVVELSEGQMFRQVQRLVGPGTPVHFYGRMGGAAPTPFELMHQVQSLARGDA